MAALNYAELQSCWRKGLRRGNLRKLSLLENGFYRAAMWYAKVKEKIVNERVVAMLEDIIEKLVETVKDRIFRVGLAIADEMQRGCEKVFAWAPRLRDWLKDPDYIFWLGLLKVRRKGIRK